MMISDRNTLFSPLEKHVNRFVDADRQFSPSTVAEGLAKIHGHKTGTKGSVIATFNATHASSNIICPVSHGKFVADEKTGYARTLHMGTTRIWNADGSINEARWEKFAAFVTAGQNTADEKIVTLSSLKKYLLECYHQDEQELDTGRNTLAFFSSKAVQGYAATAAWDELYDRMACGWIAKEGSPTELEPYMTLALIREFFEDTDTALLRAESQELPKPAALSNYTATFKLT